MTEKITTFIGEYCFLSNFYRSPITWAGKTWPTVEHAYQAAKTSDPVVQEAIRVLELPNQAKRAGRYVQIRPDWEDVKVDLMMELVDIKFTQHPELKQRLLDTSDLYIEEGNTWRDTFWGVCPPGGSGKNFLGRILMSLRHFYRTNEHIDPTEW